MKAYVFSFTTNAHVVSFCTGTVGLWARLCLLGVVVYEVFGAQGGFGSEKETGHFVCLFVS